MEALCERFPCCPATVVAQALEEANQHGGRAARLLRKAGHVPRSGGVADEEVETPEQAWGRNQRRLDEEVRRVIEGPATDEEALLAPTPVILDAQLARLGNYSGEPSDLTSTGCRFDPDAVAPTPSELLDFEFPAEVSRVILDLGPNVHPVTPPDHETAVVSIEPLPSAAAKIAQMDLGPRHFLVQCAIAGR